MIRCPTCGSDAPAASRFCNACGAALGEGVTMTVAAPPSHASSSSDEGRFPAGTLLAGRYRILGLLGRGGMGEVYRATDLKLNQPVALKFLPEAMARDQSRLARFHNEVRIARQVSHPNVCRVYDIGELDGSPYISMEYVDGEDLGVLLRRIGRLPGDKAAEIGRRLCAGLAAAHAKGVLHRDLKPANIMLDGQGHVRIMDFGLAAAAGEIEDKRSGTPAYMSPEQKEGSEVTTRSDIYSLGLVLREMITGRRASDETKSPSLSTVVKDVDPAYERAVQRCLEPDPRNRPASALDVARALPGGDPLAEALAAGDTPSPELVAASEDTGAVSVRTAVLCFAFILVGLAGLVWAGDRTSAVKITPFPYSPEALELKARDIIVRAGYTDPPADSASGFVPDGQYREYALENVAAEEAREQLRRGQPSIASYWYMQSPRTLEPLNSEGVVRPSDPPPVTDNLVTLRLDPLGRLNNFQAVPPQIERAALPPLPDPVDWSAMFTAAGLDMSRFSPAASDRIPLVSFDSRMAWAGTWEHSPSIPLNVEAASWRGRPVYFQLVTPWRGATRSEPFDPSGRTFGIVVGVTVLCVLAFVAIALAWRNRRQGRGDPRGSWRLAVFLFGATLLAWLFQTHFVRGTAELTYVLHRLGLSLLYGALGWTLYMALEPYVRRRWPQSLISWTRLLGGNVQDPLVAGHVLIGLAQGVAINLVLAPLALILHPVFSVTAGSLEPLIGFGGAAAHALSGLREAVFSSLIGLFLFFLLRVLMRRNWLAAVLFAAVLAMVNLAPQSTALITALNFALYLIVVWLLIRFGLLTFLVGLLIALMLDFPITSDVSSWYSGVGLAALGSIVLMAGWSFRVALGGRPLWKDDFLDR